MSYAETSLSVALEMATKRLLSLESAHADIQRQLVENRHLIDVQIGRCAVLTDLLENGPEAAVTMTTLGSVDDAILLVLQEGGVKMKPKEISTAVKIGGRVDGPGPTTVGTRLRALRDRGLVSNVEHGYWEAVEAQL